jgi:hypothetical protein
VGDRQNGSGDPAAADDNVSVVENRRLPWRDGALRLVEGNENFGVRWIAIGWILRGDLFDHSRCRLVAMANLYADAHWIAQVID